MCTHMCMGSVNISLNDEAYERLKRAKKESESFSEAVIRMTSEKDITKCFGLLEGSPDIKAMRKELERSRNEKWREIR